MGACSPSLRRCCCVVAPPFFLVFGCLSLLTIRKGPNRPFNGARLAAQIAVVAAQPDVLHGPAVIERAGRRRRGEKKRGEEQCSESKKSCVCGSLSRLYSFSPENHDISSLSPELAQSIQGVVVMRSSAAIAPARVGSVRVGHDECSLLFLARCKYCCVLFSVRCVCKQKVEVLVVCFFLANFFFFFLPAPFVDSRPALIHVTYRAYLSNFHFAPRAHGVLETGRRGWEVGGGG